MTILLWILKRIPLSPKDRVRVINTLAESCELPPLHAIIREEEGRILIRDVPVEAEELIFLSEAAEQALSNQARKVVVDQIRHEASLYALQSATTWEQTIFAKAAIWAIEQQEILLKRLRGNRA